MKQLLLKYTINTFIILLGLSIPGLIISDIYWGWGGKLALWAVVPFIIFWAG